MKTISLINLLPGKNSVNKLYDISVISIMIAISFSLTGCVQKEEEISRHENVYEVVKIEPPKHFHVDLKNVKTGIVTEHVYVSKHCSVYEKLPLHSRWVFTEVDYKRGDYY